MLFIILINVFNKFYKGSLKKNIKYFLNLHYMNKNIFLMFFLKIQAYDKILHFKQTFHGKGFTALY